MNTRPEGLDDAALADALQDRWGLRVDHLAYLPLGFGSHHWRVDDGDRRWFVTVDDLDARRWSRHETREATHRWLEAALTTARSVADHHLAFVVAPVPDRDGAVVVRLEDRFTLAVYPFVEGRSHAWGDRLSPSDRRSVLDLIVALHRVPAEWREAALVDRFVVQARDELLAGLSDLDRPWDEGPYGEQARAWLAEHRLEVEATLARHDDLAAALRAQPERMVLTHGEPHPGNTMVTGRDWLLIDWDTTLVAPPERDLWLLADGDAGILDAYARATGRAVLPEALERYRVAWDLADVATAITVLHAPHDETTDTAFTWEVLRQRSGAAPTPRG